jgi:hypothetical protein
MSYFFVLQQYRIVSSPANTESEVEKGLLKSQFSVNFVFKTAMSLSRNRSQRKLEFSGFLASEGGKSVDLAANANEDKKVIHNILIIDTSNKSCY